MKPNTQKLEKNHKNSNFNFLTLNAHKLFICLISSLIRFFGIFGMNLEKIDRQKVENNTQTKTYYKMTWIDYLCKTDMRQTIRHGFILYMAVAMLAVPSALCNQQHRVISYKISIDEIASGASEIGNNLDAEDLIDEAMQAPMVDATASNKDAPPYQVHIMQAAQAYEVAPTLLQAVIMAESSNNPQAVSKRGAQGLMQLMPNTAKSLGIEDSFDPAMNIDGGARYLKYLLDRFDGDVRLALAAYNAGARYVKKYGGIPPFKATRDYIKKVLKYQKDLQAEMTTGAETGSKV